MIKLAPQSDKNSPAAYDAIFKERQLKGVDEHDMRRWKRLLKHYKGGSLIDLGCLDSNILDLLKWQKRDKDKHSRFEYVGIDASKEAIDEMNRRHPGLSYGNERTIPHYVEMDLYKTKFKNNTFDYAVLGEVIEHLEEPEKSIEEAMRILKPGGVLAISTPLEEAREPGAIDGDRHLWSFSKLDLETMLLPYGKVELDTVGSLFTWKPPFYRYCWPSLIAFCTKK